MTNKKKNNKNKNRSQNTPVPSLPYEIRSSEILGKYIVASRNIACGETIISEEPLTIGPTLSVEHTCCIGCFSKLDSGNQRKCEKCNFPVCKAECTGVSKYHSNIECDFFKEKKLSEKLPSSNLFDLIFPLRVLFLGKHSPEKFSIVEGFEAHIEARKLNNDLWTRYQEQFVEKILSMTDFSEKDIQFVLGAIDVNCFELGNEDKKVRAIFPSAFLMAHDCVCNTRHSDDPQTNAIKVMACRDIRKGEIITLSYGYTLQGTLMRREYIYQGKYFWCSCKRCSDPTELRTYTSALVCKNCEDGKVLPIDPLNQESSWKCNLCTLTLEAESVKKLLKTLYDELEAIGPHNVPKQEEFLVKYRKVLGPNHYIFLGAKYSLCQVLGKMEGYVINELSDEYLQKKETYCRQLLTMDALLQPGKSRLRGVLLYELHAPMMITSTRKIQQQKISVNQFRATIKEVIKLLTESFEILKFEPEGTSEYEVALAAKQALNSMT